MNPHVWRFMGGATVATAVDLVIPGYSRILWAGVGAALPEGSKKAGLRTGFRKGLEIVGKAEWKVLTSPKYLGRFGVRRAPSAIAAVATVPGIGWVLSAAMFADWSIRHYGSYHHFFTVLGEDIQSRSLAMPMYRRH
jgi:hypothetical protein